MAEILEKLSEEEIEIAETIFYPPALGECLFSDFGNFTEFHETKFSSVRWYQYPMLSWEAFFDFDTQVEIERKDKNLSEAEAEQLKFDYRKGASESYCVGGRTIGKTGIFQVLDLLLRIFYSLWSGAEMIGFSAFVFNRIQKVLDKVTTGCKKHKFFKEMFNCSSSRQSPYRISANTGLEITGINMSVRGKCFDIETEVLTNNGWKNYKTISYKDKALSLNLKKDKVNYYKINQINIFRYIGDIYKFFCYNKLIGCFTSEHNILYKWCHNNNWLIKPLNKFNLSKNATIDLKSKINWVGNELHEPFIFKSNKNNFKFQVDDWLEFLGWYISEGNLTLEKNLSYKIVITQHKDKNINKCLEIESLLKRLNINYWCIANKQYVFSSKIIFNYLKKKCYKINKNSRIRKKSVYCCYNKKVPDFIKNLSPRQIKIFLNAFRKGDGNQYLKNDKYVVSYNTSSKQLADDIQELILKSGSGAALHLDKDKNFIINQLNSDNRTIKIKNIVKEKFNDIVWGINVNPHNLIFIRRNGFVYWTGNSPGESFYGEHLPLLYIEEASKETDEVYRARKNSKSELGCIFRSSGMTDFRKTSPIGRILRNPKNKKYVINLPQKVNPTYTEEADKDYIEEFGGVKSSGYRIFCDGDIIEDRESIFDMEFIRDYVIDSDRDIMSYEIDKDNYSMFRTILNTIVRPKNANRIFMAADIGRAKGIGSTELVIFSEIKTNTLPTYKYLYNVTLQGLFDDDMQKDIFLHLMERLNCEMFALDIGEGTGLAIHSAIAKIYPNNLYGYYGNQKIQVGCKLDEEGNIIRENGDIVYLEEFSKEFSVKRLQQLFYKMRMDIPYCPKFEKQFDQIEAIYNSNRIVYKCLSKNDHLFDAFRIFAIAQWIWEFKNLEKPIEKKPKIAFV